MNDISGNASHNIFTATGGMTVVDRDSSGAILSLGFFGNVAPSGVTPVPEASTTVSFGLLLCLGPGGLVVSARRRKARAAE